MAEAPSVGKPIVLYDVLSIGAQAYMAVANELMAREAQIALPREHRPVREASA